MPGPVIANGTSFSAVPSRARRAHRVGADEAGVLLAAPAQPGLDRAAILGQVVAVEVEAGLHAQRVARAEPGRRGARGDDRVPDRAGGVRRDEQLDAVLARVAGAADEHARLAGDRQLLRAEARRQLPVGEPRDERARLRALDREHREVGEPVGHGRVVLARVALEPGEVALVVARVRDGQEAVRREPVGEEVVEHAALLVAEHGVLGAALGELRDVVGEQPLQQRQRSGPEVSISPMWLTSKIPARSRTAMCSSRMPPYCTGISQPANGTSLAPAATWRSCSGVRLSVSVPAAMRGAGP